MKQQENKTGCPCVMNRGGICNSTDLWPQLLKPASSRGKDPEENTAHDTWMRQALPTGFLLFLRVTSNCNTIFWAVLIFWRMQLDSRKSGWGILHCALGRALPAPLPGWRPCTHVPSDRSCPGSGRSCAGVQSSLPEAP